MGNYRGYPYGGNVNEQHIETWIGLDLIARAEETMRKRLAGIEARAQSAPSLNVIVEGILVPMRVVMGIMML